MEPFSGSERRRYARGSVNLNAVVTVNGNRIEPAMLKDYCIAGVLVTYNGPPRPVENGDRVVISFATSPEGSAERYEITGRVARVLDHGFGVMLDEPGSKAVAALEPLAAQSYAADPDVRRSVHRARQREVIAECVDIIRRHLSIILNSFFKQADEQLFLCARDAKSNAEQAEFFDSIEELKKHRDRIGSEVMDNLTFRFEHAGEADPKRLADDKLSLVDKEAFEDFLAISALITKTEKSYSGATSRLESQLSRLFSLRLSRDTNPIGVNNIFETFADAIRGISARLKILLTIYEVLEEAAVPLLADLYAELDSCLQRHAILPDPQERAPKLAKTPRSPKAPVPRDQTRGGSTLPGQDFFYPEQVKEVGSRAYQAVESLMSLAQPARSETHSEKAREPFSVSDIVEGLTALQKEQRTPWIDGMITSDLDERLQHFLSSRYGQERRITTAEMKTIGMVSNVVDAIAADELVSDQIKQKINALLIPLSKLALQNRQFLGSQSHPVKILLNKIGQLDEALSEIEGETQRNMKTSLDAIMERLGTESESVPYQELLAELDEMIESQKGLYVERLNKLVEECRQQQELLRSRRRDEAAGGGSQSKDDENLSPEWRLWIDRAKKLKAGDVCMLRKSGNQRQKVVLAWIGMDFNPFVFVDRAGKKTATMTLQEVAMQLRRGTLESSGGDERSLLERALVSSVYKIHAEIQRKATVDEMTGLLNRPRFEQRIGDIIENARRGKGEAVLVCIDLNCLAKLRERWEAAAPRLLQEVGGVLQVRLGADAVAARLYEEKFGLLFPNKAYRDGPVIAADLMEALIAYRFHWQRQKFSLRPAIGWLLLNHESEAASAVSLVEEACTQAKRSQGTRIKAVAEPPANDTRAIDWGRWLEQTLAKPELYCQRVVSLAKAESVLDQLEMLVGVVDNAGGFQRPGTELDDDRYAPKAKELDRVVLQQVLKFMAERRFRLKEVECCLINLSSHSVRDPSTIDFVLDRLHNIPVPPGKVCLQIGHEIAVRHLSETERLVRTIKEFGCRFTLDDFGSRDVNQSLLNSVPVDYLKIDGSFIRNMARSPDDRAMVQSINEIGHMMGKKVIAQCACDDATLDQLKEIGIDFAHCVKSPLPLAEGLN